MSKHLTVFNYKLKLFFFHPIQNYFQTAKPIISKKTLKLRVMRTRVKPSRKPRQENLFSKPSWDYVARPSPQTKQQKPFEGRTLFRPYIFLYSNHSNSVLRR